MLQKHRLVKWAVDGVELGRAGWGGGGDFVWAFLSQRLMKVMRDVTESTWSWAIYPEPVGLQSKA